MISSTTRIYSRKRPVTAAPLTRQEGGAASGSTQAKNTGGTRAPDRSGSGDADVSFGLASELQGLAASGVTDIDHAAVSAIKEEIANGTDEVDPGRIADGVLATARELLGR